MKKEWFITGGILTLLFTIPSVYYLLISGLQARSATEIIYLLLTIILIAIVISLGIYYIKIGLKEMRKSKFLNISVILSLIGVIFMIIGVIGSIYKFTHNYSQQVGALFPLFLMYVPFFLLNFAAFILTAINYFKK